MFAQRLRLPLRRLPGYFDTARRIHSISFSLFFQRNDSLRVALIAPKKQFALSTMRNSVKRQFARVFSKWAENQKISGDLVFVLRRQLLTKTDEELAQELMSVFAQMNAIARSPEKANETP